MLASFQVSPTAALPNFGHVCKHVVLIWVPAGRPERAKVVPYLARYLLVLPLLPATGNVAKSVVALPARLLLVGCNADFWWVKVHNNRCHRPLKGRCPRLSASAMPSPRYSAASCKLGSRHMLHKAAMRGWYYR